MESRQRGLRDAGQIGANLIWRICNFANRTAQSTLIWNVTLLMAIFITEDDSPMMVKANALKRNTNRRFRFENSVNFRDCKTLARGFNLDHSKLSEFFTVFHHSKLRESPALYREWFERERLQAPRPKSSQWEIHKDDQTFYRSERISPRRTVQILAEPFPINRENRNEFAANESNWSDSRTDRRTSRDSEWMVCKEAL